MLRFNTNLPFDRERRITVALEGNFANKDVQALRAGFNLAAITVLTPDYIPWLKSKGGSCPATYPDLLVHKFGNNGECVCGAKASAVVPVESVVPASTAKPKPEAPEVEAETKPRGKKKARAEAEE